jgi:ATP-dependent Lon protease
MNIMSEISAAELADQVASTLDIKGSERQEILETTDVKTRLEKVTEFLSREVKVLELERKISNKTQEQFEKSTKEAILRERIRVMEKELGEEDVSEFKELEQKLKKAGMPKDIEEKTRKELKKLQQMTPYNPEAGYIRNWLELIIALPWNTKTKSTVNIKEAEKILDEEHYGLAKVKERIVEYLAVHKLSGKMKGPILCFAGPPGFGPMSSAMFWSFSSLDLLPDLRSWLTGIMPWTARKPNTMNCRLPSAEGIRRPFKIFSTAREGWSSGITPSQPLPRRCLWSSLS